jgi:putative MFS transporter
MTIDTDNFRVTEAVGPAHDAAQSVGAWFEQMPFTRAHWVAGLVLFVAFVIESWEMMIIILCGASIGAEFHLDTADIGSLIGAIFLGMIPGALMWGKLVDRFGRKTCLVWSLALYGFLPLASALAPSVGVLWWLRFVCGIVLSGVLVVTFPFFEELVPVKSRGRATVYLSAGWPLGVLVAIGVTYVLMDSGWRWVISFSSLAGLWAIVVYKLLDESPYWLTEKGRLDEAQDAIHRLSRGRLSAVVKPMEIAAHPDGKISFFDIFRRPVARITLLQTVINFCFSWGYWALASWMPALLAKKGLSAPEGLSFMAISALFMFPGYIAASYLTGKFGRKKVMLGFVFIAAVAGFGFANSASITQMYFWNFTLSFFSLGAWGVWNTWLGELYTTDTRGAGFAWGVSAQRVANAVAPVIIGAMLGSSSFLQTVTFISTFLAITLFAAMFLPETEGKVLQ